MVGGLQVATERPAPAQVKEVPRAERAQRPDLRKGGQVAQAEFERIINEKKAGNLNPREALSGIVGWREMGKVDAKIISMNREVIYLRDSGVISEEKATDLFLRIRDFSEASTKLFLPRLHKLGDIVIANEKEGEVIDPFLRDLNYHSIKYDIKSLEASGDPNDPNSKFELDQLKKDLVLAEKDRTGLGPEQDEIVNLFLKLTGKKALPMEFQDSPLDAIDAYFMHNNLSAVLRNPNQANKLAARMGISVGQVRLLVNTYNQGSQLEVSLEQLSEEITVLDPEKGKKLRTKNKIKSVFNIAGLLSIFSAYAIYAQIKKESGQQVG